MATEFIDIVVRERLFIDVVPQYSHSVPPGGTTGQVLAKKSNSNNDLEWKDIEEGGGTVNTVNGVAPDVNKNVQLEASDVGADAEGAAAAAQAAAVSSANGYTDGEIDALAAATASALSGKQNALGFAPENLSNKKTVLSNTVGEYPDMSLLHSLVNGGLIAKNYFPNPAIITHTGTTAETMLLCVPVPPNTFRALDELNFFIRTVIITQSGNTTFRLYFSPTNTLPAAGGVRQIGMYTLTTTALAFKRRMWFNNATNLQMQLRTSSLANDETSSFVGAGQQSSISVDLSVINYIILSCQLAAVGAQAGVYQSQCLLVRP